MNKLDGRTKAGKIAKRNDWMHDMFAKRIAEMKREEVSTEAEAAVKLEHARMYLATQPMELQNLIVDPICNRLYNPAIPILFNAECVVRLIDAKYLQTL
jgi:hypothetical protein